VAGRQGRDFLVTVTAYDESYTGPIRYESLRERIAELGLHDYLVNDSQEWIALPTNVFATWVQGDDCDNILEEWNRKLGSLFGAGRPRGAFLVTVGTAAAWQAQVFE
jgi:hypothetical protein